MRHSWNQFQFSSLPSCTLFTVYEPRRETSNGVIVSWMGFSQDNRNIKRTASCNYLNLRIRFVPRSTDATRRCAFESNRRCWRSRYHLGCTVPLAIYSWFGFFILLFGTGTELHTVMTTRNRWEIVNVSKLSTVDSLHRVCGENGEKFYCFVEEILTFY